MNVIRFQSAAMLHWLWLVPVLVGLLIFAARRRQVALQAFIDAGLLDRIRISVSPARRQAKAAMVLGGLVFLIFGLARPGWNPKAETIQRRGRDVVFLIDVSKSMLAEDLAPNRMERAKLAVQDAVDRLAGDRVGLVVFAGTSVVKCPLTLDYGFFRMMLEDVSTDSISRGGTLIGEQVIEASTLLAPLLPWLQAKHGPERAAACERGGGEQGAPAGPHSPAPPLPPQTPRRGTPWPCCCRTASRRATRPSSRPSASSARTRPCPCR